MLYENHLLIGSRVVYYLLFKLAEQVLDPVCFHSFHYVLLVLWKLV